jgi:scyllo-inositol 2-dehydrogenase (NADP+)
MTSPHDICVALIGYGIAGSRFHGPLIEATTGLELSAVVTSNPERAQQVASTHKSARVLASVEDIWADPTQFDVVVVASPNAMHAEHAEAALRAGLTVVVDKPLAGTLEDAERLLAAAAESTGRLTAFQNRRWDADFLTVRDIVDGARLGDVRRFESRMERWQPEVKEGWREHADARAGGGVLFDLGAHIIDQAVQLFGPVASVYAEQFKTRAGVSVDDDSFVALRHDSGVVSHLWMSKTSAENDARFRLLGARGAFMKSGIDPQEDQAMTGVPVGSSTWGAEDPANWGTLTDGTDTVRIPSRLGAYQEFYIGLRDALDNGRPLPVDPADSLYVLRLIAAARTSATTGSIVAVNADGKAA